MQGNLFFKFGFRAAGGTFGEWGYERTGSKSKKITETFIIFRLGKDFTQKCFQKNPIGSG